MELEITAFYCLCDDFLISEGWLAARQCTMSTAEVMTAAAFFSGSHEKSCNFLKEHGYITDILSKSQFSRLGGIPESVWRGLMSQLAVPFHESDSSRGQLSCPCLPEHPHTALQNISRGCVSSRKEYFYGYTHDRIKKYFCLQGHIQTQVLFMTFHFLFLLEVSFLETKRIMLKMNLNSQMFI
jgi:hypothetical protein